MDSLTQIALGAAVGEATMGRKVGHKAMAWGALAGTLPDLDVFIPLADAVSDFTYHRSFSHSVFVLALLTPLLVWLINKVHPQHREHTGRWALAIYLVFLTHVLLDAFTAYGTQILWPVVTTPVAWSTIFIIDPLYTVPLLVGLIGTLVVTRHGNRRQVWNSIGLTLSSLYLAWTVVAKFMVDNTFEEALKQQNIAYKKFFTTPIAFNSLLWRTVVKGKNGYYEGYYSLLDEDKRIDFRFYPSDEVLLKGVEDHWPVQRLQWFSKGFYSVSAREQDIVITDLRMGFEPNYVFSFKVAEMSNPHAHPTIPVQLQPEFDSQLLGRVWDRIWDQAVIIHTAETQEH